LEKENSQLKRLVAEISLEKQVLKEIAEGNFKAPNGVGHQLSMRANSME
jgi:hypothetical protein